MPRLNGKPSAALIELVLGEASWLLSHAQALADYGRDGEAAAEWARAADCEEQAACLLEADGQATDAAIHRVSAASCCGKIGQHARAVTLLRAALPALPGGDYRSRVEKQLGETLAQARKQARLTFKQRSHKASSAQR